MYRKKHFFHKLYTRLLIGLSAGCLMLSQPLTVSAELTKEERIGTNQALAVESNEIAGWPTGPVVSAESAILIEAETGTILYSKNIHQQHFPASTTKILTTLIAIEECSLSELVSFSTDAVFDIDRGSNHIAIDVGEKLTMEQCLNAILIRSANEVSLAVAEHISGGAWEDFAPIMNSRAKELGCLNSNFVNPNGLPNEEHVTTAYDLAMIGRAFFANETLCQITLTPRLRIPASEYQPDDIVETNKMELISTGSYAYEYLVGCKTGYTNDARSTLVSCAEKNGMKLICVVLKDESPNHYEDTIALFEYGFSNFDKVNVSRTETKYNIASNDSFYSDKDIFGSSEPLLSLNEDACIILPKTAEFKDAKSSISYDTADDSQAAIIHYTYKGVDIGSASVDFTVTESEAASFSPVQSEQTSNTTEEEPAYIFIDYKKVLIGIGIAIVLVIVVFLLRAFLKNYHFSTPGSRRSRRRERRSRRGYLSTESSFRQQRRQQIRQARKRRHARRPNYKFRDYD